MKISKVVLINHLQLAADYLEKESGWDDDPISAQSKIELAESIDEMCKEIDKAETVELV